MKILRTVSELRAWRQLHKTLGFVPTMGALHEGHLNLVNRALADNDATLLSIFVNPSQFSPTEDLDRYPRTFDSDVSKFANRTEQVSPTRETAVFAPTVREMYPNGIDLRVEHQRGTFVEVLGCSHQLEGAVRPHFFRGVATVVAKLLNSAQPTRAYFGQKDVQQTVVVRQMVRDLLMPTEIVVCPTQREPSGLAMSSRNAYLDPDTRQRASILYKALLSAKTAFDSGSVTSAASIEEGVRNVLSQEPGLISKIEYISLNDYNTFETLDKAKREAVLSAAVELKTGTRILDNVIF